MPYVRRFTVSLIIFLGLIAVWKVLVKENSPSVKVGVVSTSVDLGKFKDGECVKHVTSKDPEFMIKAHEGERYKLVSLENGKPVLLIRINPAYGLFSYMDKFYEKVECDKMDLSNLKVADKERLYQMRILLMKQDLKIN